MKRFFFYAVILMHSEDCYVIPDLDRIYPNHAITDLLVFTYDSNDGEGSIEITEGFGNEEESGRSPSEKSTYSLSPEMEKVLEYWGQFK